MKVAPDMQFHGMGFRLFAGDPIPEELAKRLGPSHPLIAKATADPPPDTEADEK